VGVYIYEVHSEVNGVRWEEVMERYTCKLKTIQIKVSDPVEDTRLTGPEDAVVLLRSIYDELLDDDQEHFVVLFLGAGRRGVVTGFKVLFSGAQACILTDVKVIFRNALLFGATAIVLAHNHPSGDLEPNEADVSITKRCVEAGRLLGIQVLDHIIISPTGWISLKREERRLFQPSVIDLMIGW